MVEESNDLPNVKEKTDRIIARMRKSNEKLLATGVGVFSIIGEVACTLLASKEAITRDDLLSTLQEQLEHIPNLPLDLERMAIEAAITRLQKLQNEA